MEQPPNIDHFFREHLHDAEVAPPALVWPRVEAELRRRRRRFFLWLWFGLGLAGAGLWSLWPWHPPVDYFAVAPKEETVWPSEILRPADQAEKNRHLAFVSAVGKPGPGLDDQAQNGVASRREGSFLKTYPTQQRLRPIAAKSDATEILTVFSTEKGLPTMVATDLLPPAPMMLLPGKESGFVVAPPAPGLVLPKAKPFVFKKKKPLKNCYDFARHPQVWLADAYFGPSLPQRQLTTAQSGFEDYLQQRRSTEHNGWAFNAGVRGSLLFGRHFLLRTGLHYEQMTEVFEYADPDFIQVTITQTTKLVDGVWQTIIDTIGVTYGEHYVKTYNRFGMLEVPLLAGAEFRHGRAGLSLQAGAALNLYFWKRGTILNAQGDPESFTPDRAGASSPVFRQRAGWSATASAQLFYHLRSRSRLFVEPYYSRSFRPLTLANQPIEQRYAIWGLKLGFTRIFD